MDSNYKAPKYWENLLASKLDEQGVCWPTWPKTYNKWLHKQQEISFGNILQKYDIDVEGKSVAEIGPGMGFWTNLFKQLKATKYNGFEISKSATELLNTKFPEFSIINTDFSKFLVDDTMESKFDVAFSAMVFLHITDNNNFENCINNFSKLLKKDGYFIILDSVSNNYLRGNDKQVEDSACFNADKHNKIRITSKYMEVYAQNGFDCVAITPAYSTTQQPYDFKNYVSYLLWGKLYFSIHAVLLKFMGEKLGNIYGNFQVNLLDKFVTKNLKMDISAKWFIFKKV